MVIALDWPTIVLLVVVNGAVDVGAVAWVSGYWSRKKIERWLTSPESDPYIDRVVTRVAQKLPSVEAITKAVVADLPEPPDLSDKFSLMEEKIGTKLTDAMNAKWSVLEEELSTRVGRVVQANIASAKAAFSASNRELSELGDNDGSMLAEIGGIFMDEDSVKKLSRASKLLRRMKAAGGPKALFDQVSGGGQANPQAGYQPGQMVRNDRGLWILGQDNQWKLLEAAPVPTPVPPAGATLSTSAPAELPPELPAESKAK